LGNYAEGESLSLWERVAEGRVRVPHPPLRGTLSQRERDLAVDRHNPVRNPG